MQTFKEYVNEGKAEALVIRTALKKELGLSSKDVSVKTKSGGYSSAVNVTIKTAKALSMMKKIEAIGNSEESYERDNYGAGDILSGGNTFVFVNIDYKFQQSLYKLIQAEFDKQSGGKWEEGDYVTLFGTFNIGFQRGATHLSMKGGGRAFQVMDTNYVGSPLMLLIAEQDKDELYSKIK